MSALSRYAALLGLLLAACQAPVRKPTTPVADEPVAELAIPREPAPSAEPTTPIATPEAATPAPVARPRTGADVFAQLTSHLADPPCVKDRVVQRWEKTYGRWAPKFRSNIEAILPLLAYVLDELQTHHLPAEFALLPIVESWYRPDAGSARTAYGMWQFTTATARNQGLRIVPGYDERLAPAASTRAAMRYLSELQNRFGDWRLANMAYNAGEYRVMRVLARTRFDARPSAGSHLPAGLSMTTYEHLAKVQALACLLAEPERFGIALPREVVVPSLETQPFGSAETTLDAVARARGVSPAEMLRLNPAFLGGRIVRDARREVLVTRREGVAAATAAPTTADAAPATSAPPREYRVRSGDTLGAIAARHRVALADLLRWNRLDAKTLIHPGQRLRLEP